MKEHNMKGAGEKDDEEDDILLSQMKHFEQQRKPKNWYLQPVHLLLIRDTNLHQLVLSPKVPYQIT